MTHRVNLFDIHNKYGDVLPLTEIVGYLRALPDGTYASVERYRSDIPPPGAAAP